jgi:hypothetical protein
MELPADPPPAGGTELEQLEKEQALGETENMGCPGVETPNAVKTVAPRGPAKIPGKTATPGDRPTTIETCTGKTRKRAGKT